MKTKENVCEKNCPDYSGMAILHKEQCDCSCHTKNKPLFPLLDDDIPDWEHEQEDKPWEIPMVRGRTKQK